MIATDTDTILAEIEFLQLENARLKAARAPSGFYATNGVYTFKGKSEVRRLNTPPLPCGCRMYVDVLTPGRWRALGRTIAQGVSACLRVGRTWTTPIFCRCQLVPSDTRDAITTIGDINDIPF